MGEQDWLAQRFEEHRSRMTAVAYRMLGSSSEADDAVQEVWLRLSRTDSSAVHNLGGWLTTVVGRVCLDILRSRAAHREEPLDEHLLDPAVDSCDPEAEALMAESVGQALLVVLDSLAPAERLAFVLHDLFAVPFEQIGSILGRSPNAAKQLASRARHRMQAADPRPRFDTTPQSELVTAFLARRPRWDFAALLEILAPNVVLRADATAVSAGATAEVYGAPSVAKQFAERAIETLAALVVEPSGAVWAVTRATPRAAFRFTARHARIVQIDIVFDPGQLHQFDLAAFKSGLDP